MVINNVNEQFMHGIQDMYDAEQLFLEGMQQMLQKAGDQNLKSMISNHIDQTRQQIRNLEQVFDILGQSPQRTSCITAQALTQEAGQIMQDTQGNLSLLNMVITEAADKVEHFEVASYRGLITEADMMGQRDIVSLLQQNLQQEETTSMLLEQSTPTLAQYALNAGPGMQYASNEYSEGAPTS